MKSGFIQIDNNIFSTLLAISEEEQSKGLMFQPWPPPIMSFVYAHPKPVSFWMKNTPSPLDIVFCREGIIQKISKGEPFSTASISGGYASDLVIEFPYGTIEDLKIKTGSKVELFNPTYIEIFKRFPKHFI